VIIVGLLAGALLSAGPASADDAYMKCIDNTSTNPEWAGCGEIYLKRLDDALNVAWKKAYESIDGESRAQLLQEQRTWIKFKEASCQFYMNGSFGREGQVLHFYGCRGPVIKARISDLNGIYDLAHEGDEPVR
jgi:uncharacterized protein YecT (DUF1311 family)